MNGSWNGHGFPRPVFIFITIGIASPVSSVANEDGKQMRKKFILTHFILKSHSPIPRFKHASKWLIFLFNKQHSTPLWLAGYGACKHMCKLYVWVGSSAFYWITFLIILPVRPGMSGSRLRTAGLKLPPSLLMLSLDAVQGHTVVFWQETMLLIPEK